jgi:hypothetical protein
MTIGVERLHITALRRRNEKGRTGLPSMPKRMKEQRRRGLAFMILLLPLILFNFHQIVVTIRTNMLHNQ